MYRGSGAQLKCLLPTAAWSSSVRSSCLSRLIFLLLLGLLFSSCRDSAPMRYAILQPTGDYWAAPLPPSVRTFSGNVRYMQARARAWLYMTDNYGHRILRYDFDNPSLPEVLPIKDKATGALLEIEEFDLIHPDTLLVVSEGIRLSFVSVEDWEPFFSIRCDTLREGPAYFHGFFLTSQFGVHAERLGRWVSIAQTPFDLAFLPGPLDKADLRRFRMFLLVDPQSKQWQFARFGLPKNYFQRGPVPCYMYNVSDGAQIAYGSWVDPDLYITRDFQHYEKISVPNRWMPERLGTYSPSDPDPERYIATHAAYGPMLYDAHRHLYYRFVRLPVSREWMQHIQDDYRHASLYPPDFVIQIFDSALELIGERRFQGHLYSMYDCFVGAKGLYLSIANPVRPDYSEDSVRFELLEVLWE